MVDSWATSGVSGLFTSGNDLLGATGAETEEQRRKRLLAQQQQRLLPNVGGGALSPMSMSPTDFAAAVMGGR